MSNELVKYKKANRQRKAIILAKSGYKSEQEYLISITPKVKYTAQEERINSSIVTNYIVKDINAETLETIKLIRSDVQDCILLISTLIKVIDKNTK